MSEKIEITIDEKAVEVDRDLSVLDACRHEGYSIPTLCEIEHIPEPFGGCRLCLVEIETDRGSMITTSCDTPISPGMKVSTFSEEIAAGRRAALELLLSEHTGDCVAPCSLECPATLDVQGYLAHIANGDPRAAVKLIKEKTPLAISLGRACFAPCEEECRRQMVEDPISIRQEKQYVAEVDIDEPWTPEIPGDTGKSVGVVGGGPAGLTAAYFLRLKGHEVKIYDMMPELGGMMRYGIPNYRLPKDLLDREIDWILDLGVEVQTRVEFGEDIHIEDLKEIHDAVFISTGAWESWMVPIKGKDLPRVYGGIDFLVDHALGNEVDIGEKVMVVGCGNTAMDVARTARRLGKEVTLVYRRSAEQAPASDEEMKEAMEEGIKFEYLTNPEEICGCEVNGVSKVTCARMELGEPDASGRPRPVKIEGETVEFEADSVILAIGQSPEVDKLEQEGLSIEKYTLTVNDKFSTNIEGVFAAGDVALGPCSIVECTGHAREAAYAVNAYLNGGLDAYTPHEDYKLPFGYNHIDEKDEEDFADWNRMPGIRMPVRIPEERVKDFDGIELGFDSETAGSEAERCLECGCLDRFECRLKEYSTDHGAKQENFEGFKHDYEIDESHPRIIRDPNKCILCGSCVRTTEEHGEGVVQFVERGFQTIVEPAFGDPLGDSDSKLVGSLADACPTGAFEEVLPSVKPGPFELVEMGTTYCQGCGLGCPAKVYGDGERSLKLSPIEGHLCDIGKFESLPHMFEDQAGELDDVDGYTIDVYASLKATSEELEALKKLAHATGGGVHADVPSIVSTADREDLLSSEEIYVDEEAFSLCPVLKDLVPPSSRKKGPDAPISVVTASEDVEGKRVVAQSGANAVGLYLDDIRPLMSKEFEVLLVYDQEVPENVDADYIIQMVSDSRLLSDKADVQIPIRSWLQKGGTVVNIFGETIELEPVVPSNLPSNVEKINGLLE